MQYNSNKILKDLDFGRYTKFCEGEYSKMAVFVEDLKIDPSVPVQPKLLTEFYTRVRAYQKSAEFRMKCLTLFDNVAFSEDHLHLCFNISNEIRKFHLNKKAEQFPIGERKLSQRSVGNASHAKVRYVGGYCIAKLQEKYRKKSGRACTNWMRLVEHLIKSLW